MNKKIKYLLLGSILLMGFVFVNNTVLATGTACGVSSEGVCKVACDPYDEIYMGDLTKSGSVCATSPDGISEQCCIKTRCTSNNIGFGECKSSNSCDYGSVGIYTSDCVPPSICCVLPKSSGMETGNEIISPITNTESTDIFTGEDKTNSTEDGTGLVPCSGMDCSLCDIFILLKNLINLFTELVFAFAAAFIVWGAIEIMIAGGDEKKVVSGRGRITTAVIGVSLALGAWLLVGTVLQILTDSPSKLPWNKIECSSKPLSLPRVETGSDIACLNKGGSCLDKNLVPCNNGKYEPGLCLSSKNAASASIQCCVPENISPVTMPTCKAPQHQCLDSKIDAALIRRSTPVAGEVCADKTKSCYDVGTEPISPSAPI